jgi:hypothetical protein
MKKRNFFLSFAVIVMAIGTACAPKADDAKDFKATPAEGGKGVVIAEYLGDKFVVRIPPRIQDIPVTAIGNGAFRGKPVTSVTMPSSVTTIGHTAFEGCIGLAGITIPNNVTSLGSEAFFGCTGLASVTIPNSVTSLGGSAFRECTSLTSVTIPNSVTSIGDSAFKACTGLTSVTIPDSVTSIGNAAFYGCTSLTSITFQNAIASGNFGYNVFSGDLRSIYPAGGPGTYTRPNGASETWTKQ